MVIRRGNISWGESSPSAEIHFSNENLNTACAANHDASNDWLEKPLSVLSNCNSQNQVKWENTFHMRQMNLCNFSAQASGQMRQTLSAQAAGIKLRGRCMTSASKSLDLLRLNIQTLINKEIDAVLNKYLDKFFKPAVQNIRNNLGENSVTEDNIKMVCRQILEDAKNQYYSTSQSRGSSPYSDSETGCLGDYRFGHSINKNPMLLYHNKRKESDTDSEASQSVMKPKKKSSKVGPSLVPGVSASLKLMKIENIRREGPKWDPNRIVESTLFIMGARANKVLGFGQTRGRLYTKHPELLKYSGDAEDKEWLSRQNLIPPTGGIAYLLILEDVKELAESEEYRHNPNVLLGDLKGFKAPEFMLKKIRSFIAGARSNDKLTFIYSNDVNHTNTRQNYMSDCDSLVMTPPPTILESAPSTPSEFLELGDYSNTLLVPTHSNEFAYRGTNSIVYDGMADTESNKTSQSFPFSSETTCESNSNSSALASLLVSSYVETNNAKEKV